MRKNEIKVHCKTCGNILVRCPSTVKESNFCNQICYAEEKRKKWLSGSNPRWHGGKLKLKCLNCEEIFFSQSHGKIEVKVCSRECYAEYRSKVYVGNNHPNFKGAGGRITKPIRSLKRYRDWRLAILIRDKHKCIECQSPKQLHIHHIINLAVIVNDIIKTNGTLNYSDKRLWDINNGITLCTRCHKDKHKKMGRIAGTPHKVA